ncbi:MAG: glycosyltransferase [Phycisphaerae bacterium]|nr:glycosyltransferase [Phycisphaerae bacterium]
MDAMLLAALSSPSEMSVWAIGGWLFAVVCVVGLFNAMREYLRPRRLADVDPTEPVGVAWPSVAIVVPACNEESMIRQALESLIRLDYEPLHIVVVDDRSTDRTGEIVDELASDSDRLTAIHVEELPEGWLGKNHANWLGACRSDSEWILFTDGDVVFEPDALKRAVRHAERNGLDHVTLVPGVVPGGMWENVMLYTFLFFFTLYFRPWRARKPGTRSYIGAGAFNMIRRNVYERIGTHRRLALEIIDDTKLGKLVKRAGFTQDFVDGQEYVRVRWQEGLWGIVTGLEKNGFAAFDYSLARAVAATISVASVLVITYGAAFLAPGLDRGGYLLGLTMIHATFGALLWRGGVSPTLTLLLPLMCAVQLFIIYRSAYLTLRHGGITWRGTFYPLEELRRGLV